MTKTACFCALVLTCTLSLRVEGQSGTAARQNKDEIVTTHGGRAESLVNACAEKPENSAAQLAYCFGYIEGIWDMHQAVKSMPGVAQSSTLCIPNDASPAQLAKVIAKYGNDHPEELHEAAIILVINALLRSFPCK